MTFEGKIDKMQLGLYTFLKFSAVEIAAITAALLTDSFECYWFLLSLRPTRDCWTML